jgi:hypothetical protein
MDFSTPSRRPFKNRSGKERGDFEGRGVAVYIKPRKSSEQRSPERIFQPLPGGRSKTVLARSGAILKGAV